MTPRQKRISEDWRSLFASKSLRPSLNIITTLLRIESQEFKALLLVAQRRSLPVGCVLGYNSSHSTSKMRATESMWWKRKDWFTRIWCCRHQCSRRVLRLGGIGIQSWIIDRALFQVGNLCMMSRLSLFVSFRTKACIFKVRCYRGWI